MQRIDSRLLIHLLMELSAEITLRTLPYLLMASQEQAQRLAYYEEYWPHHNRWLNNAREYCQEGDPGVEAIANEINDLRYCLPSPKKNITTLEKQLEEITLTVFLVHYESHMDSAKKDILYRLRNMEAPEEDCRYIEQMEELEQIASFLASRAKNKGKGGNVPKTARCSGPAAEEELVKELKPIIAGTIERQALEESIEWAIDDSIVGLIGGPGTGKTVTAVRVASRYKAAYLINCENEQSFLESLKLPAENAEALEDAALDRLHRLAKGNRSKVLFIFDNMPDRNSRIWKVLTAVRRQIQNAGVLYTARIKAGLSDFRCVEILVEEFTQEEARRYLMDYAGSKPGQELVDAVIKQYSRLPIVLSTVRILAELGGGYENLGNVHRHRDDGQAELDGLMKDLFSKLEQTKDGAVFIDLLCIAALLYNEMDRELLCEITRRIGISAFETRNVLDNYLEKAFLLIAKGETLMIHRAYQDSILHGGMISQEKMESLAQIVVGIISEEIRWKCITGREQIYKLRKYAKHIDRIYDLDIPEIRRNMQSVIAACIRYYGLYYGIESERYLQYKQELENADDILLRLISQCECALVEAETTNGVQAEAVELLHEIADEIQEDDSEELAAVKVRVFYALAIMERLLGNAEAALNMAECCLQAAEAKLQTVIRDQEDFFYYLTHKALAKHQQAQVERQLNANYEKSIQLNQQAMEVLLVKGMQRLYINEEIRKEFCYLSSVFRNGIAVNYYERNENVQDLEAAVKIHKELLTYYYEIDAYLDIENQYSNLSELSRKIAEYYKEDAELFESHLQQAEEYLEQGYEVRENQDLMNRKYKTIYYTNRYQICYQRLNHPSGDMEAWFLKAVEFLQKAIQSIADFEPGAELLTCAEKLIEQNIQPYRVLQLVRYQAVLYRRMAQHMTLEAEERVRAAKKAEEYLQYGIRTASARKMQRALQYLYRELVIVYDIQNQKENLRQLLLEMKEAYKETDPKSQLGIWYQKKCEVYGIC